MNTQTDNPFYSLKEYYSYVQGGLLTLDNLKAVLGFEEIVISGTIINSANEGQSASLGDIWTDEAFMCFRQDSNDLKALNFARTYNWTATDGSGPGGISTFTYDENEIDSRVVRGDGGELDTYIPYPAAA